jgi:L-iditol 2-dehydrogenase
VLSATEGRGPDIVIEAAGSARAVEEGLDIVRDGGVYVIAGHYTDVGASTISAHHHINRKHLDVRGCWGSEVRHFATALHVSVSRRRRPPHRADSFRRRGCLDRD